MSDDSSMNTDSRPYALKQTQKESLLAKLIVGIERYVSLYAIICPKCCTLVTINNLKLTRI